MLTEVPRAIRRAAARDPRLPLDALIARARVIVDALARLPLDRGLLAAATCRARPARAGCDSYRRRCPALPDDAFVTYDERQAAAARLAALRTVSPAG